MGLRRLPADAPVEDLLAVIEEDGGLIIEGLFEKETIEQLLEDALAAAEQIEPGAATQGLGEEGKVFTGSNTIRFSSVGKISAAYFELLDNPVYAALADAVLLPNCGSYWVNTAQVMLIGPDSDAQMLHRDCGNWEYVSATNWPNSPEVTLSAMIALDEITEELGATRVIPGSHKWTDWEDNGSPEMTVPAEMSTGDALVYSGKVVHGGGANRTRDRWRNAMHLSFVVGWLTPEESSPIDYSDEDLRNYSPRVQRLLGHRSYDPRPHAGGGLWLRNVRKIEETADL
jgi:ectoine hydroxylase-related dioxygenase (phytanoyl-CoA dioxygenase family)